MLNFEIDKLTHSIEHLESGLSFDTQVVPIERADLKLVLKKNRWLFDWRSEWKRPDTEVYKLVAVDSPDVIQGIISLIDKKDHVNMSLIETAPHNYGKNKVYLGVAGNLVAYACLMAFEKGYDGNIAFMAKTALIEHYERTLGAIHFGGGLMIIRQVAANHLCKTYYDGKK